MPLITEFIELTDDTIPVNGGDTIRIELPTGTIIKKRVCGVAPRPDGTGRSIALEEIEPR